ncbi:hypothetical protein J2R98_001198 [Alkalibacillus filiformis]|uniref:Protein YoaJ n=1 Tax=Alkalibacillus filiformis TaxID=200990 RepID=A0ABU0DSQ9_9BACI|nr:hypothetical protein [Alkalibacillus filiformis]
MNKLVAGSIIIAVLICIVTIFVSMAQYGW